MSQDRKVSIPEGPVIPRQTYSLVKQIISPQECHAGLLLDKFSEFPEESERKMQEFQKKALNEVCKSRGDRKLLKSLNSRRSQMLEKANAMPLLMRTQGAMTLHLSRAGTWENAGISLHPIYGFVYLPGSGLKGLARAWAETVWAPAQPNQEQAWRTIEDAFGYTPNSEKAKIRNKKGGWRPPDVSLRTSSATGQLVFHDAWPSAWPHLEVDITNSHFTKYYQGNRAPDDTEDPNPVYFLAVGPGVEFQFAVSDRKRSSDDPLLEQGLEWLQDALTAEGAGAKTGAGYGRFVAEKPTSVTESPSVIRKEYDLEFISMAFLAGANQDKQDCDLRPATLRGLLRWWWRTMHTGHVDLDTLCKLEAAIWGDSKTGSPVRIQLKRLSISKVGLFNKPHQTKRHTLGLAYASYGMDERNNKSKRRAQRWYSHAGSRWSMTVSIRNGYYETKRPLTSDVILRQVEASIWLLTKYGGVGSRSRKGFGSFDDVKIEEFTLLMTAKISVKPLGKSAQLILMDVLVHQPLKR